jgi:hypothetical protein
MSMQPGEHVVGGGGSTGRKVSRDDSK